MFTFGICEILEDQPLPFVPGMVRVFSDNCFLDPHVFITPPFTLPSSCLTILDGKTDLLPLCPFLAGAAQLQFNSKNEFVLASAHGSIVKIWDTRKGTLPTLELRTRGKRVYGIDWNPKEEHEILISTQDAVIEFWDIRSGGRNRSRIHTDHPMRRVRFTPFGRGVLAMPQRGSNSLQLYAAPPPSSPPAFSSTAGEGGEGWATERAFLDPFASITAPGTSSFSFSSPSSAPPSPFHSSPSSPTASPIPSIPSSPINSSNNPRSGEDEVVYGSFARPATPAWTFRGHTDAVISFTWRSRTDGSSGPQDRMEKDNRHYQLISWAQDKQLRLWPIESRTYSVCSLPSLLPFSLIGVE